MWWHLNYKKDHHGMCLTSSLENKLNFLCPFDHRSTKWKVWSPKLLFSEAKILVISKYSFQFVVFTLASRLKRFQNKGHVCVLSHFSRVQLFVTPWTVAPMLCQWGFSSGLPCPPSGYLPDPGIEPVSCSSCAAGRFFTAELPGKPQNKGTKC